jgi:hypothetical protein
VNITKNSEEKGPKKPGDWTVVIKKEEEDV